MENLCVFQDYRKQGIGKRLFIEAKKRALEFNKNAIDFYENQGMETRSRILEMIL